jgi:hypothetical protein
MQEKNENTIYIKLKIIKDIVKCKFQSFFPSSPIIRKAKEPSIWLCFRCRIEIFYFYITVHHFYGGLI